MGKWKTAMLTAVLSLAMAAPALAEDGMAGDMNTMTGQMDSPAMSDMTGKDGTGMTMMKDGVAYSALRKAAEGLGYTVDWNGADMTVTLTISVKKTGADGMMENKGMMTMNVIKLRMGSATVQVNGASIMLEAAPYEKNGTSYVPATFVTILSKYAM